MRLSASISMDRNLYTANGLPPSPARSCRKNTGPFEVALIANMIGTDSGIDAEIPTNAPATSIVRFQVGIGFTKNGTNPAFSS